MDKVVAKLITLPSVTLFAIAEAWLATKYAPEQLPDRNGLAWSLLSILVLNYVFYAIYLGLIWPYFVSPIRHFPTPKARQAVWSYWSGMARRPPGAHFLEWASNDPEVVPAGLMLLRSPFVTSRLCATSPKALGEILVTNSYDFEKPGNVRDFLRHVLGDGLIIVESETHKFQRKRVMPAFSFRHIKDLYPMMWRKAVAMTDAVAVEVKENPAPTGEKGGWSGTTEINNWASKVTLDIIGVAGLGRDFNVLKNNDEELVKVYEELLEPKTDKLFYFLARSFGPRGPITGEPLITRLPWKLNDDFKRLSSGLRTICGQLVRDKREAIKLGGDEHFDILSLLIKSDDFSDDELVSQLLTFLAAGHETTSSALTWATFLLSTHPDIQSSLREEVRTAIPHNPLANPSFPPSIDLAATLERLPLLNAICNETLRLYPTVPITVRVATKPTTILGNPIPAGTEIMISPWAINRLPQLWGDDAAEFKPQRWIDGEGPEARANNNGGAESNYAYLSFLHGPRQCIGQGFARAELRSLLAAFVGRFEWMLDDKVENIVPGGVITIKPKDGLKVKVKEVEHWEHTGDAAN